MTKLQHRREARHKRENWSRYALLVVILLMLAVTARNVSAILANSSASQQQQGSGMSIAVRPPAEEKPGGEEADPQPGAAAEGEEELASGEGEETPFLDSGTETAIATNPEPAAGGNLQAAQQSGPISNVLTASITASILEATGAEWLVIASWLSFAGKK